MNQKSKLNKVLHLYITFLILSATQRALQRHTNITSDDGAAFQGACLPLGDHCAAQGHCGTRTP